MTPIELIDLYNRLGAKGIVEQICFKFILTKGVRALESNLPMMDEKIQFETSASCSNFQFGLQQQH
jgi:hypothetical protein